MPIHSEKNLYAGVNPHLNSFLQNTTRRWGNFHTQHISDLVRTLDMQLPPGYASAAEESLQIRQITFAEPFSPTQASSSKADVLIYGSSSSGSISSPLAPSSPVAELSLVESETEDESLPSVIIYRLDEAGLPDTPVTRVEVLSPANKPGGSHYSQYRRKRLESLKSGLNLVEIDYLHQTRPILPTLPSYADDEAGAFPFWVIVSDPHPAFEDGQALVYGASVDMELPRIRLPLAGDDEIIFDLHIAYNQTCVSSRMFRQAIDYAQLPVRFDLYSDEDQARIRERIAIIAQNVGLSNEA